MNIVYCSSDEYCEYTGISIISLFDNNREIKKLNVYIIDDNIGEKNKKRFREIEIKYNRKITFINCNKELISLEGKVPSFNGSFTPYIKLLLDKIFPIEVKCIVYIDSDTIINGNISELEDINMEKKIIAGVENPNFYINFFNDEEQAIVEKNKFYFNSGVMYVNLEYWREINFSQKIFEQVRNLKKMAFVDQTILNASINNEIFKSLPFKFNYWDHQLTIRKKIAENEIYKKCFSIMGLREARENPIIIHYKGKLSRPWYLESTSIFQNRYLHYKSISPWSFTPLKSFIKDDYYRNMSFKNKLSYRLLILAVKIKKICILKNRGM